jgi:mannan endo-1,4-beta-mannosidase
MSAPYILIFFRPSFSFLGQIDVTTIPDQGSWLQLIKDGTTQINTGANGIQRLDKLIALAKQHNIYIYFTLTNNWFPSTTDTPTPSMAPSPLPRNFLSNDYGRYLMLVELCALFPD